MKPMALTSVYFLTYSASSKLSKEASQPDSNLRRLVGHANMLDCLRSDLLLKEQEQERWLIKSKSVSGAKESGRNEPRGAEVDLEVVYEDEESDLEEEQEQEQEQLKTIATNAETNSGDAENYGDLALTHISSQHLPPGMRSDPDPDPESGSEDEQMQLSQIQLPFGVFTEKQRQAISTTSYYDAKDIDLPPTDQVAFKKEHFFLPSKQQPTIIAAY